MLNNPLHPASTNNPHRPSEIILWGGAVGLPHAGIPLDQFNPDAPIAGCRLCGAIIQTKYHRRLYDLRQLGVNPPVLIAKVLSINDDWREKHTKRKHTQEEVERFSRTGAAFTPEAAKVLAPFGIIPLGNMTQDHVDALFEADRKPDLTYLEGGE